MTRMTWLAAVALGACSPAAKSEPDPTSTPPRTVAAPTASPRPAATPMAVEPKPGELKTFRDWIVGCDNTLTCEMASLGPDGGDFPGVTMSVSRDAGPAGGWRVALDGETDPAAVAVDGAEVARGHVFDGAAAARIVAALADGTALEARDGHNTAMARISLAGAAAALRYIDAQQGRAGGVAAAVAKGGTPANAVPPAAPLPLVEAVAPGGTAVRPTAAQIAAMRKGAGCDADSFVAKTDPETHALGDGATLVFVPCSSGAYNLSSALYVLKGGRFEAARTDAASGFGFEDMDGPLHPAQVVNGAFEDGLVTSYAKGRGLGDCGITQAFAWDGRRLRLVRQAEMNECRGNTDTITTWRATVTRR